MQSIVPRADKSAAIRTDLGAIFVSLELNRWTWLITSLSPGAGEKMSKHAVPGGNIPGSLRRLFELKEKARRRIRKGFPIIVIQEAGLDGFRIHRVLEQEGIESHIVDSASIMKSRRRRRAKTDRIDGLTTYAMPSSTVADVCRSADHQACITARSVASSFNQIPFEPKSPWSE
jgi:transposase